MLKSGDIIEFDRKKQFKYIKPLGAGGTGDTHLFEDETTDMMFAFKKYSPKNLEYINENYARFVDEIKILFKISHHNIVRVYNYYLYPDSKLGYLQMEYINGVSIDQYKPDGWGKDWDVIFSEVIDAFEYLEYNNILHRDIRPANILIDTDQNIKVIDFGFGKKLDSKEQNGKSVVLNWPVTELPEETYIDGTYNHQTEIYFIGKLFQHLLDDNLEKFKFSYIIDKMTKVKSSHRYKSFSEVSKAISSGVLGEIDFTPEEKECYKIFANELSNHINHYVDRFNPVNNLDITLNGFAELIKDSCLEEYIQDNSKLIGCFINGGYSYKSGPYIEVAIVTNFYNLLKRLTHPKQKIVLDNIYTRLSKIKVESDDELPF
ncbi:MAG: protein kinase family protein [Ruminiclostridium sp.]